MTIPMVRLPRFLLAAAASTFLNAIFVVSVALPPSSISSPQLSDNSRPFQAASYPPEQLSPLPPSMPLVSAAKAIRKKKSPPPPKKSHTPAQTPRHNKAAELLKLTHVPLKTSCQILRTFYNMTQGSYWSNQDGWQYVDSVAIPGPQPGRPPTGRRQHSNIEVSRRQVKPSADSDSQPFVASSSGNLNRARNIVQNDNSVDDSSSSGPETHPDNHPDTMPRPPEGGNDDRPRGAHDVGEDPSSMPGTNPSTELDVDNCCGWYGVVCIGPDGKFPPHWPPFDEDLISSRFSTSDPVLSTAPLEHFNKRREPYYSYHDRQWRHHHLGGNRGGRGRDDGHDGDDGIYDGRTDDGESRTPQGPEDSPINMPGDTAPDWGEGSKMPDIDDWYIIELHLGFNGLVGLVPDILSKLVNLMILDLSSNELEGQIPESYSNLTRLERFDIGSNKITGPFPVSVTKMINIQELVLKNNYFAGHLPIELLQLKRLTELSIANNEFDGLLPQGLFSSLKKLRVFNINQNGFTGEISSDVGGLTGLIKFAARANEFTGNIPKEFGNCKLLSSILQPERNVKRLTRTIVNRNLGDNHLTGEIPESIYTLRNLKILDLPGNKLSGKISPEIGNMAGLTKLILSHNNFNDSLPVEIQNLKRLESMVVNYNSFSGVFPVARAPPLMTFCLVQPNSFQGCPSNASVENSTTLAYQCNLDCSDRVLHPDIYTISSRILFTAVAAIVLGIIL
ncbi:hypothetical protein BGZ92_006887 [Podila epicladia]|nr:hypothetical protein BGZ92_006887 [Podila epicladia]